jgi:beta-mannosidase
MLEELALRPRLAGGCGMLAFSAVLRTLGPAPTRLSVRLSGPSGTVDAQLDLRAADDGTLHAQGELALPGASLWWPHTHGEPILHDVTVEATHDDDTLLLARRRIGFRTLRTCGLLSEDGLQLEVNGVRVFARGAVWTPLDLLAPHGDSEALDAALLAVRSAGMNMLRIPGTATYESDEFYDRCDELGIFVWQDFMFASLDYPEGDPAFVQIVASEVRQELARLGGRPCLAVLCGGSEVAQQVAMLGLDAALADGVLFGELLPSLVEQANLDAFYVPSAPWGVDLPFRTGSGIANYFGVGAYRRPLADARAAGVRFAAECLAFANVPDESALSEIEGEMPGGIAVHHPRWKAGVPRDPGAGWDFDDARDHYLKLLFGLDPVELRSVDQDRYLELSRAVTGEVMSEVLGEWRRERSGCGGALVLWLRDLLAGAGWGLLDNRGHPKPAYHHVRRALAPVAAWSTDEGLDGIAVHIANDGPEALNAQLRVATYRDFELPAGSGARTVNLKPHASWVGGVEQLLQRFVDVSWAYRFGRPAQDLVVVSLERDGDLLSQTFRMPSGRPTGREPAHRLGLRARGVDSGDGGIELAIESVRFAYGVRIHATGYDSDDDAFSVEPGGRREVRLRLRDDVRPSNVLTISALNLSGRLAVEVAQEC